jgi:hypothetical protein
MDDRLKEQIELAALNGPDMRVAAKPTAASQFVDSKNKADILTRNDPNTRYIGIPKTAFKPNDFCDKFADLLVNHVSRNLNESNLALKVQDFLALLVRTYGSAYKVSQDWFGQKRRVVTKPNGKGLTIAKVIARLGKYGIEVPAINTVEMSFNDVRKHLQGKGGNQEFTMKLDSLVVLGRSRVLINRKVFHWVNTMGTECAPETAVALRAAVSINNTAPAMSLISIDLLESLLGIDRPEIERRCNTAPL